ncbi:MULTISPECIES: hypothetical protein [Agrobacterium]|uniref:DUF1036 domain-containing protein n=1 Tax=Agrobacterium larrymoorei TaxID=160699 RepID=A0ABU0UQH6_9HYPH|nr:hypothetical protein [Agrobacterium larrymoorei]MDQ1186998.1 hypothetical protein [Agrobacterium larrymoorei]MDQ1196682.1 hypothetical protein [Rhizobium sp. SORGH_AS_0787]
MKQAIAALLLACMPFAAAARDAPEIKDPVLWGKFGTWRVQMQPNLDNTCVVMSAFETGHDLMFWRYFKKGKPGFFLSVGNEKWKSLVHKKVYSVNFEFDEGINWDVETTAYVQGTNRRLMMKSSLQDFLDGFKSSKAVKMFYEKKEIAHLSLSGVEEAIEEMDACQKTTDEFFKISRTKPDTSDPFARKSSTQASDDPFKP